MNLNTDKNTMPAVLTDTRSEDGRPLIAGLVELYFRTRSRLIVLRVPGEPDFMLKLAANPPRLRRIWALAARGSYRRRTRRGASQSRPK